MRCKVGDLAFIRKALRPQNIGLIVQCTEYIGPLIKGEKFKWNGEMWTAIDTGDFWVITSPTGSIETQYGKSKQAHTLDAWLTPIKAEPEQNSVSTEKTLETEIHQ